MPNVLVSFLINGSTPSKEFQMDLVIRISREDLLAALTGTSPTASVSATAIAPAAKAKPAKAPKPAPVEEEFDETEEETPKPAKKAKSKPAPVAAPVEEEEEETEEEEESEDDESEEEEESDDEEFITGEDLVKLKKALNAHKASQGGKPKKTLEILRKYAPGGSEKVKPDQFPKLLKALKV
jgi:hypothetical protein